MQVTAVVVGGRLRDLEHDPFAALADPPVGELKVRDDRVAILVGVVDEQPAVVGDHRVERQAQQPALTAAADAIADVEGDLWWTLPARQPQDATGLLDDIQVTAAVVRRGHGHRLIEALDDGCRTRL